MRRIVLLLATGFGAGYSPIAPGTCGTAVAVALVWACAWLSVWQWALASAGIVALAVAVADRADRIWGTHDSGRIVIDEIAGYSITMVALDRADPSQLAAGFILFRVLDITKPGPIRWIDRNLPGGYGVVLDDALAGVIGAAILYVFASAAGI